ncbi:biotin--[acetyl-CoA-carboxylase] ligase [Caminibacter pacificus]|uniref:Biotin--[acetyl-CoA-carboxylase] ligase n=1 Tax=Caminibacter pacificus TaxID=1424653 RepID=A0AAJ4UXZ4_9BACT|nr:biotin--[acetyl-CoA-carboxylase] ligase [Caminibacter pacificus]NPA87491.1 biotin--[acetyl-CoA-carboxylase] ligase [Campylobacterota bacterium]QCI27890.1 biotin--[acetyl-CoA-carboxylase] ligase [Caminibacter pacificus]ROR39932.1 BirA family biotin operon repressor/biotin-[acetyl-CoA-carboxylase] ligase [Caminibacter pacificus]
MRFIYLKEVDSTQKYLLKALKNSVIKPPVCVWSEYQTAGIGTRGNSWIGERGNLFFSFAYLKNEFSFVPIQSLSIYFGFIFKKTLNNLGSKAVLKWPNDIYLSKKIGGVLTQIVENHIVCGIGLNTQKNVGEFESLDIKIKNDKILKEYFETLQTKPSWEMIIDEYKREFELTKDFFGIEGDLSDDGAIIKNNKKVYSRR